MARNPDIDFPDLEMALFRQPWSRPCCIVDGAQRPSIALELEEHGASFQCLFNGELDPEVAAVAPYLVDLQGETALAEWLFTIGWGQNLGIYLLTGMEFLDVRKHFRRITMVRMPDNEVTYFRFYDPRVLRSFLPTCNENQLQFVYGDVVEQFVFEDGEGAVATLALDEIAIRDI